jgi:radical SAM-linked protein
MPNDTVLATTLEEDLEMAVNEEPPAPPPLPEVLWPLRLRFAKEGPARFISHLETGTILERAFRIAEIRIGYSQGHSAHPKFHFGPPLPVGIAGTGELLDIEIAVAWSREMLQRLNAVLPIGFRLIDAKPLPAVEGMRKVSLSQEACIGRYEADLTGLAELRRATIGEILERYGAAPEWTVRKGRRDDDTRMVDLKRACLDLAWDASGCRMTMDLRVLDAEGHTTNPARIFGGIFGLDAEDQARCFVTRTALLRADLSVI